MLILLLHLQQDRYHSTIVRETNDFKTLSNLAPIMKCHIPMAMRSSQKPKQKG